MKKVFLAAAMLTSSSAFALDLKGMEVDKPINCALLELISEEQKAACSKNDLEWMTTIDFLNRQTPAMITRSKHGLLESIVLTHFDFDGAMRTMKVQYGEPYNINPNEAVWTKKNQSIRVLRYGGFGPMLVYSGKTAERQ